MEISEKSLKQSRLMYIFEAALEYLISLLVSGSFLAKLTTELGFSDSLTGILSAVISLGCLFQLFSMMLHRKKVKTFVIFMSVINQLLFMFLYIIPIFPIGSAAKTAVFVICIILAYLIYYFAHPKKINWLMSLVDDESRGSFTASKEIVSLIAGMLFTFIMGNIVDSFTESGNTRGAFIVSAIVIFTVMILHTLSMIFAAEKELPEPKRESLAKTFSHLLENKRLLSVMLILAVYYIAHYASLPFYGTYQISELGFSLTFVSILTMITSIIRISVSKLWGRYADKRSFLALTEKCFIFLALSFFAVFLATPANGAIMFIIYNVFHGIAMGGINSATVNLVFESSPPEKRADALALCQAAAGTLGFVTTLLVSPLISWMQSRGNTLFGMTVYAQQLISLLSLAVTVGGIIYVRFLLGHHNKIRSYHEEDA